MQSSVFSRSLIYSLTAIALSSSLTGCLDQLNDPNNAAAIERASQVLGNTLPIARAGSDQSAVVGTIVTLDGSASSDKEGALMSYTWRQLSGMPVTLKSPYTSQTSFVAPTVQSDEALQFELLVTDSQGWPSSDYITITVKPTPQAATILKGKFIASPGGVAGLTYETPTQSGLTSATGEFNYQEGETVTFKVANIVLGKTTAKAQLSPFDLVGITQPPVTSAETSKTLRLMENSTAPIPFEVATNITTFLQTLDDDSNLANGIVIPSAINTIATGKLLRFDQDSSARFKHNHVFKYIIGEGRLSGLWGGIKGTLMYTKVLDNLYKGLNLVPNIPKVASDWRNTAQFSSTAETYTFDTNSQQLTKYVRMFSSLIEMPTQFDMKVIHSYNPLGSLVDSKAYNNINDTVTGATLKDHIVFDYDANNLLTYTKQTLTNDVSGNTTDFFDVFDHDKYGQLNTISSALSISSPSILESYEYSYNNLGLVSQMRFGTTFKYLYSTTYSYDSMGRKISELRVKGSDSITQEDSTIMDWATLVETTISKKDLNQDGLLDVASQKTTKYDAQHRVLESKIEEDTDGDKKWDYIETTQSQYDLEGNRALYNKLIDNNGDGKADQNSREQLSIANNKMTLIQEEDTKGDSVFKLVKSEEKLLDENGNWIVSDIKNADLTQNHAERGYKNYSQWFPMYKVVQEPDRRIIVDEVYN